MTWASVGSIVQTTSTSLSLNPVSIGDLILLEIICTGTTTTTCTSISGGGATWVQVGSMFAGSNNSDTSVIFAGTVTATGSATATLTFNGSASAIRAAGQEFSSTVGSWALDGSQGNLDSAGGTNTWPSLTPAGAGELYFGYAFNSGSASNGSTSGYTYQSDAHSNGMAYNAACTSGAQAPVWGDSTQKFGVVILMKETGGANVTSTGGLAMAAMAWQGTGTETIGSHGGLAMAPMAWHGTGTETGSNVTSTGHLAMAPMAWHGLSSSPAGPPVGGNQRQAGRSSTKKWLLYADL